MVSDETISLRQIAIGEAQVANGEAEGSVANQGSVLGTSAKLFAAESTHWYLPDGTPFYTVPYADKKREGEFRPVTLADARKVDAVPSVTMVIKAAAARWLEEYKAKEILKAAWKYAWKVSNPFQMPLFYDWASEVMEESKAHAKRRSKEGDDLHARLDGKPDSRYDDHYTLVRAALKQFGIDLDIGATEHSFACSKGYGGKVDYHQACREMGIVIDHKTKHEVVPGKIYATDEHVMQIAAYRNGLGLPQARCLNVFVGVTPPVVTIHEWPEKDLQRGWRMFDLILKYWQEKNCYFPTK